MICGGAVTILLQKIEPHAHTTFSSVHDKCQTGHQPVLLTLLASERRTMEIIEYNAETKEKLGEKITEQLEAKKWRQPFLLHSERYDIYVEPLISPSRVHIIGAGHVGHALAQLAAFIDFQVTVIDDRQEFANPDRFESGLEIRVVDSFTNCIDQLFQDDYVVIVTRGHLHDQEVLAQALKTEAGYIGMIGSTRKRDAIYRSLLQIGFQQKDIDRVASPIGLAIGAQTPNEIAISIAAQLLQARAKSS